MVLLVLFVALGFLKRPQMLEYIITTQLSQVYDLLLLRKIKTLWYLDDELIEEMRKGHCRILCRLNLQPYWSIWGVDDVVSHSVSKSKILKRCGECGEVLDMIMAIDWRLTHRPDQSINQ